MLSKDLPKHVQQQLAKSAEHPAMSQRIVRKSLQATTKLEQQAQRIVALEAELASSKKRARGGSDDGHEAEETHSAVCDLLVFLRPSAQHSVTPTPVDTKH